MSDKNSDFYKDFEKNAHDSTDYSKPLVIDSPMRRLRGKITDFANYMKEVVIPSISSIFSKKEEVTNNLPINVIGKTINQYEADKAADKDNSKDEKTIPVGMSHKEPKEPIVTEEAVEQFNEQDDSIDGSADSGSSEGNIQGTSKSIEAADIQIDKNVPTVGIIGIDESFDKETSHEEKEGKVVDDKEKNDKGNKQGLKAEEIAIEDEQKNIDIQGKPKDKEDIKDIEPDF